MKNLKKVLALVVVFSMMLCSVAFAAFPDVAEDADYANAVNTLAALGIVGGDDQGNFNPDNTITRAEFTKMICEAQAIKGDAAKGATIFTDVAADHWASGYINMGVGQGIINGMGDGTFAPEAPVTYEQAIKMIVVALGYEPMAADRGGWPTGYMVVAQSIGLTKGVSAPAQADAAIRSLVAELIFNALDTPMMQQTGFGDEKNFEIMDGSKDKERVTLLTEKFDVVKLGGVVTANANSSIEGTAGDDKVIVKVYNTYKSTNTDFSGAAWATANLPKLAPAFFVGETDVADYLGEKVIVYVEEVYNGYEVIAVLPDVAAETITVDLSDIDLSTSGSGRTDLPDGSAATDKGTIAYFEDGSKNSIKLDVTGDTIVTLNGETVAGTTPPVDAIDADARAGKSGIVTFYDWNADSVFDYAKMERYSHFVVDSINANNMRIKTTNNKTFRLDADEEDLDITIKDVDGNDVAFEDIKVDDVIAVIADNATSPWNATKYINVVVLGESTVEGTVTAFDDSGVLERATIGDATYDISNGYIGNKAVDIASEGVFYLDIDGKIFDFDGTKAASGNLGIILKAATVSSGVDANVAQVKMLNKDGQIVVYNLAESVKIRKDNDSLVTFKRADVANDSDVAGFKAASASDAAHIFYGTSFDDAVITATETIGDYLGNTTDGLFKDEIAFSGSTWNTTINDRVVQYKANANGEITEITPNGVTGRFTAKAVAPGAPYNANTMKFTGAGSIDDSTIVFSLNKNEIAKSKTVSTSALIDDATYDVIVIEEDDVDEAVAVVLLSGGASVGANADGMAVVTAKSKTTDEVGNDAYLLTVVRNGDSTEETILVTEDTAIDDNVTGVSGNAVANAALMNVGSVLLYTADEEGNATVIIPVAYVDATNDGYTTLTTGGTIGGDSFAVVTGDALAFNKSGKEIITTAGLIEIENATNLYRLNNANLNRMTIDVGSYDGGNVEAPEIASGALKGNAFLAVKIDGDVTDVIAIDKKVNSATVTSAVTSSSATITLGDVDYTKVTAIGGTVTGTIAATDSSGDAVITIAGTSGTTYEVQIFIGGNSVGTVSVTLS